MRRNREVRREPEAFYKAGVFRPAEGFQICFALVAERVVEMFTKSGLCVVLSVVALLALSAHVCPGHVHQCGQLQLRGPGDSHGRRLPFASIRLVDGH